MLKKKLRSMKSKSQIKGGNFGDDDAPLDFETNNQKVGSITAGQSPQNKVFNPQKLNIRDLEKELEMNKKSKESLVQKHLNYKVKSDRMIEKLSTLNSTANSKISIQEKEIKFYIQKLKDFVKRNINMLSKEHCVELENILNGRGKAAQLEEITESTGIGARRKSTMNPASDYDANLQLQAILEEQERYKKLITASTKNKNFRRSMLGKYPIGVSSRSPTVKKDAQFFSVRPSEMDKSDVLSANDRPSEDLTSKKSAMSKQVTQINAK